jgi:5-methylcytosine-specific restriction protein B
MSEGKGNRFLKYFPLLLDALRSKHPVPMRPAEATAWIRSKYDVPAEDLARSIVNGKQTIFQNDVHWARFYLAKAGLITAPKRGLWGLTAEGHGSHLNSDETWDLYVRIREENRTAGSADEEGAAPESSDEESELGVSYWFVGAVWDKTDDQTPRFLKEGIWQNGYDQLFSELVRKMKPGDRIAIKAAFVQKFNLPFDVGGKSVSVMRIKATGTIIEHIDERTVKVTWDPTVAPRDWYFYTYRTTVVEADTGDENAQRLIDFTFSKAEQDYRSFLSQPYWIAKYGIKSEPPVVEPKKEPANTDDLIEIGEESTYGIQDILDEGCFLASGELEKILQRWHSKKNLVLQGPPGTGEDLAGKAPWICDGRIE